MKKGLKETTAKMIKVTGVEKAFKFLSILRKLILLDFAFKLYYAIVSYERAIVS